MTDYRKLVEALRCCSKDKCGQCEYEWNPNREFCMNSMCADAADAIERLIAERDEAKTDLAAVGRAYIREIEKHEPKRGEDDGGAG